MIRLGPNKFLIETAADLPTRLIGCSDLYADAETTAFEPTTKAFFPYKGHRACGWGFTADDCPDAYYLPIRHHFTDGTEHPGNVSLESALPFMRDLIHGCKRWINPNVKFDAHVAAVDGAEFLPSTRLVCTIVGAKLLNSDMMYRGGYYTDNLAKLWLNRDISQFEKALKEHLECVKLPRNKKAQDYALVPPDVMGLYACEDALTARDLGQYVAKNMPTECMDVWNTEQLLTPVLYDIEREGMHVDPVELMTRELEVLVKMAGITQLLHGMIGYAIDPAKTDDCFELLVNHYGLPILAYDEKSGNPTFNKHAMMQYEMHPDIAGNPTRLRVVQLMREYRKYNTLMNFFIKPYQQHHVNGVLHPSYNQCVRSGRMSCKQPNAQQLSKDAKALIHPAPGCAFLSCDYSQVEFRIIAHYVRDAKIIAAYAADPDTDFHSWVAEMCGIPRKPAKNVNFAIGFGAGRRKILQMLTGNLELMNGVADRVQELITNGAVPEPQRKGMFDALCRRRAEDVYNNYHETIPGLSAWSNYATARAKERGYVFNGYKRRRYLTPNASHIAFNAVVQGHAADLMKERTVAVAPRYNERTRAFGLRLCGSVHDETLITGDVEATRNPHAVAHVVSTLEDVRYKLSIPIRTGASWSDKTWADASNDDAEVEVMRELVLEDDD